MVPGRKFSRRTSLRWTSFLRMSWPSGALRFRVRLFLLRLTDMKYVASSPTNGGQLRVSSPLPGSSTLMTSAPMSPSIIEQKGAASTRVRSRTRMPARGGVVADWVRDGEGSVFGTGPSFPGALGQAPGDGVHPIAGATGAPPEQAGAVERAELGEVEHVVDGLDGYPRTDLDPPRLRAVEDEASSAVQPDEGDLEGGPGALRGGVQGRERDDLAHAGQGGRGHGHGVTRTVQRRRRNHHFAARTPRRRNGFDHCSEAFACGARRGWPGLGARGCACSEAF